MGSAELDLTGDTHAQDEKPNHKRKRRAEILSTTNASSSKPGTNASTVIDLTGDTEDDSEELQNRSKPKKKLKSDTDDVEKRLKRYRPHPPQKYLEVHNRAMTQRMFVIERVRGGTMDCPEEILRIAGSTGNVYTVKIAQLPQCDCPHALKGNECKHVIFALARVLRAPANLQYQSAFLTVELREIFAEAPPIVPVDSSDSAADGNRKPIGPDDNCPICFMEFEDGFTNTVFCKAACGNNIHEECMRQWAASRKRSSAPVTCPFCRTPWLVEDDGVVKRVAKTGPKNQEGYVNVGGELGLSGRRDYSSYYPFWARRQAGDDDDYYEH